MKLLVSLVVLLALPPVAGHALDSLSLPYPVQEAVAQPAATGSYDLPIAGWTGQELPIRRFEGVIDRRAWRLDAPGAALLEVLSPLRDQLLAQGFTISLDCETRACGGFDFRFGTEVLPEPGMHVDLGEFRFLAAIRGNEAVSLFISRSAGSAFVQMISVGKTALPAPVPGNAPPPAVPAIPVPGELVAPAPEGMVATLDAGLPVALDDLQFASGSGALTPGEYASLVQLGQWMNADPARRLILVGHTDASGGMTGNVALSKKRAEAVRQSLIRDHGIAADRLQAEGVGPLAPRADNRSEDGRAANRRVEAVPAPT